MNQFGLIIEETTAGSNIQFSSSHLDRTDPEIKETLTDERTLACQLANLSDVYSIQATKNYKIYSLIVTSLTDFLGRSGYYGIRLYAPKNIQLTNFESILATIKEKYNNYTKTNTLNIQNYDDILSTILVVENNTKSFVSLKSHINSFYYFDENTPALSAVFNTKEIYLVNKLYAFNKNKALPENIAINAGLKPFSALNASQREINITNNHGFLKDLKVNNQTVDFNSRLSDLSLLCQINDTATYTTSDNNNAKIINASFVSVDRKFVPKPPVRQYSAPKEKNKGFFNQFGMYLILLVMVGLLGGGGWFFFLRKEKTNNINKHEQIDGDSNNSEDNVSNTVDSTQIAFEFDGDEKKFIFKTNYKGLTDYRFRYFKTWQFQKLGPDSKINDGKWKQFEENTLERTMKLSTKQERLAFENALSLFLGSEFTIEQKSPNSKGENKDRKEAGKKKGEIPKANTTKTGNVKKEAGEKPTENQDNLGVGNGKT